MDVSVAISAGTALVGALLGSFGAPLLQGRLADRTSLRQERMVLYAQAMLHAHFINRRLQWLVDPHNTPSTTEEETRQRRDLRQVPDPITARMQLIAHKNVRKAWIELLDANEELEYQVAEENPGFRQPGSDPMEALQTDDKSVVRLDSASKQFERTCRQALHVTD